MKTCNPLTRVCLACAICVNTSVTQAQTHEDQYAVFRKGKPVGRVMAIQTFSAAGKQTVIKVELSSTIVIPIKVNAATRNQFDGKGVMQSASFIQRATGGFNKNTQITKEGSSYKWLGEKCRCYDLIMNPVTLKWTYGPCNSKCVSACPVGK